MSTKPNHRRGEDRRQDNGPRWEGPTPNSGGSGIAKGRRRWKRLRARQERRGLAAPASWGRPKGLPYLKLTSESAADVVCCLEARTAGRTAVALAAGILGALDTPALQTLQLVQSATCGNAPSFVLDDLVSRADEAGG